MRIVSGGASGQVAELTEGHLDLSPQPYRLELLFQEVNGLKLTALFLGFKFTRSFEIYISVPTPNQLRIIIPVLEACCLIYSKYCYKKC